MGAPSGLDVAIGEHVEYSGSEHAPGVCRVVGVDEETVTLLRVTDADGNRRATGEVVTTERPLTDVESTPDPDAGIDPVRWLRNQLDGLVWTVRMLTGL